MDPMDRGWELDELETIRSMLLLYKKNFEDMRDSDRTRFVTREKFAQISSTMIDCMERSVSQTERLLDQTEGMLDSLRELTSVVKALVDKTVYLQNRLEEIPTGQPPLTELQK